MFVLWPILAAIFGDPNAPFRGRLVHDICIYITAVEVIFTLFLVFLVADAMFFSRAFIMRLTLVSTEWPQATIGKFGGQLGLSDFDLAD